MSLEVLDVLNINPQNEFSSDEIMHFSPKQSLAYRTLLEDVIKILLYGGAKGGGKSVFLVRWMFLSCVELINKYKIGPRRFPLPVGFMGRKRSIDFKDTTLETWKEFVPSRGYEIRGGDQEIIIQGRVKVQYGGFDDRETVKKFNSAEYIKIGIDQAEEISRSDFGLVYATLRRKIGEYIPKYSVLLTANPADCWLKNDIVNEKNRMKGSTFIPALPSDNPFLPEDYLDTLKIAFKHRPELLEAYLRGSWEALMATDKVIRSLWIQDSINRELRFNPETKITVMDIAAGGDDTVIYDLEGYEIKHEDISGEKDTMKSAAKAVVHVNQFRSDMLVIDKCGLGRSVYDKCRELLGPRKHLVYGLDSAESPKTERKELEFRNVRDEMWWYVGNDLFAECLTSIPNDDVLIADLGSPSYEIKNGQIQVEEKKDIKARLNRSPDRGDAYVMGCYAQQFVERRRKFSSQKARHPKGAI